MRPIYFLAIASLWVGCASTPKNKLLYYRVKVQSGESLAQIAQKFDTTWQAIVRDNALQSPDQIKPGQILKVKPGPGGYLAGSDGMQRKTVTHQSHQRSPGLWERLFGDDNQEDTDSNSGGLLFGGGNEGDLSAELIWPLRGRLTSKYGYRWLKQHKGIDIDGRTGDRVVAAAPGNVTFAGWQRGYGNIIMIDHGDLRTRYAHLSKMVVTKGARVGRGDYIGQVGSTGNASGSHLHFEVRNRSSEALNPINYLPDDPLLSAR